MKRANIYRRWTDARLARELVKAARRAALLAEENDRRCREYEKRVELEDRERRETTKADHETSFLLGHRANP